MTALVCFLVGAVGGLVAMALDKNERENLYRAGCYLAWHIFRVRIGWRKNR